MKAFQYKILNSILYTNKKLFKIGYSGHDKWTFCDNESETLDHLFLYCSFSNIFWTHFEKYYFMLTKKSRVLSNQDIILGIITSPCPLLNYLILRSSGQSFRESIHPKLERFSFHSISWHSSSWQYWLLPIDRGIFHGFQYHLHHPEACSCRDMTIIL